MKVWEDQYGITTVSLLKPPQGEIQAWRKEGKLAVPPNLTIKREIMRVVHEGLITGHPGRDETIAQTQRNYWWCNALTGVKARRWRWVTLSPRYWVGRPSDTDGGRAPYAAVLSNDPSWSSKLARCLVRQCKRICAKAETSQRRVSK